MIMESNYDFSDAVKNPFAGREKGKYTVTVHYDFTEKSDADAVNKVQKPLRKQSKRSTGTTVK